MWMARTKAALIVWFALAAVFLFFLPPASPQQPIPKEIEEPSKPKINLDYWQKFENTFSAEGSPGLQTHPLALAMLQAADIPYDTIVIQHPVRPLATYQVEPLTNPITLPASDLPFLKLRVLSDKFLFREIVKAGGITVKSLEFFENRMIRQVQQFIEGKDPLKTGAPRQGISPLDALIIGEQTLEKVLRFHESARRTGIRAGKGWEWLEKSLLKQLQEIRLGKIRVFVRERQWDKATGELGILFANDPGKESLENLGGLLSDLVDGANVAGHNHARVREIQGLVLAWERRLYSTAAQGPVSSTLHSRADKLLLEAEKSLTDGNSIQAKEFLLRALELNPGNEHAQNLNNRLVPRQSLLKVGVRKLPSRWDPFPMATESELAAIDLAYESLFMNRLENLDSMAATPVLANSTHEGARHCRITLGRGCFFSNGLPAASADILQSWQESWGVNGPPDQMDMSPGRDPLAVFVRFPHNGNNPYAFLKFKILQEPAENGKADRTRRTGTGPYQFSGHGMELGRPYMAFLAQPYFSFREGKTGKPWIKEVRFFQTATPEEDLRAGKLDFALNLSPQATGAKNAANSSLVFGSTAKTGQNRRVFFLAVNPGKGLLAKAETRKALAHAIRREDILNSVWPGSAQEIFTRPLRDILPLISPKPLSPTDLWEPDLAAAFLRQAIDQSEEGKPLAFSLKYPGGDDRLAKAIKMLCEQIHSTLGITLNPEEIPHKDYWEKAVQARDFELAFGWHDFDDNQFMPMRLLRHWLPGRLASANVGWQELEDQARAMLEQPDNSGFKKARQGFLDSARKLQPLIPLWQIDRHWAWRKGVHPEITDPNHLFLQAADWRIDP
ncbi:MAG: hypothetical protein EXR99_07980 [Gemmataceae bacterium]|nr:hypothetical protein [Gemmataceae bacterium]